MYLPLLCVFLSLPGPSHAELPDFSHDYYVEDLLTGSILSDFIGDVRYDNEDKPRQCRIDICVTGFTRDNQKGVFEWPDALIETKVYLRCPYSVRNPAYASRSCIFEQEGFLVDSFIGLNNSVSAWADPNIDDCPGPPLENLLKILTEEEQSILSDQSSPIPWYSQALKDLYFTLTEYREAPISYSDIQNLASFVTRAVLITLKENTSLPRAGVQDALGVIDEMFTIDAERNNLAYRTQYENDQLMKALVLLSEMWTPPEGETTSYLTAKYLTIAAHRLPSTGQNISDSFERSEDFPNTFQTFVNVSLNEPGQADILNILFLGYTRWMEPLVWREILSYYIETGPPIFVPDPFNNGTLIPVFPEPGPPIERIERHLDRDYKYVSSIVYVSASRDHHFQSGEFKLWPDLPTDVTVEVLSTLDAYMMLRSPPDCGQIDIAKGFNGTSANFNASNWYLRMNFPLKMEDLWSCRYSSFGLYAVFADASFTDSIIVIPPPTAPPFPGPGSSFSEFLGFPYNFELFIAGEVLRAVSLACLVITVLSYLIYKSARHGIPTLILLNLSVSLILFNIILYVAESTGYTRWGCRMANILRYYLVLVSLAWNVTEAANLYLMLVKVFKSYISRFVLKAACLSWGLPLVPVIVILSIDQKGFDGIYEEDCSLKCVLKDNIFYYAYLIPVGAMVTVNIVIFSMVVHVLRHHGASRPGESRRSLLTQLCGALSMMFLLGIPWVFSAFGAINLTGSNGGLSMLSGIFQVVTIVFLNLQGTFIFLFHCVRNSDMRRQWRDTCCRWSRQKLSTSGSVPTSRHGTGSTNKTQKSTLSGSDSVKNSPSSSHKRTDVNDIVLHETSEENGVV